MNSLIDSNVQDVGDRLIRLTKQQKELAPKNLVLRCRYRLQPCTVQG